MHFRLNRFEFRFVASLTCSGQIWLADRTLVKARKALGRTRSGPLDDGGRALEMDFGNCNENKEDGDKGGEGKSCTHCGRAEGLL